MFVDYAPGWTSAFDYVIYAAFFVAFLVAFGMGANDCANSYGTVVGSGVLKLWKAYILATIFETLGATLLGYKVTNTMRKMIVTVDIYDVHSAEYSYPIKSIKNESFGYFLLNETCPAEEAIRNGSLYQSAKENGLNFSTFTGKCDTYTGAEFLLGELGALIGTAFWLILATVIHLPVSTTHSAVGATIGFSLVLKGSDGINWSTIRNIVISWVASPALAGFFSVIFYLLIKYTVLNREYPFDASINMMPIFYFVAILINSFSILYDGSKYLHLDTLSWWVVALISLAISSVVAVSMQVWGRKAVRESVLKSMAALNSESKNDLNSVSMAKIAVGTNGISKEPTMNTTASQVRIKIEGPDNEEDLSQRNGKSRSGSRTNLPSVRGSKFETNSTFKFGTETANSTTLTPTPYLSSTRKEGAVDARSLSERLKRLKTPVDENPLAAQVFNYLQVLSACFLSFSHGSNDTANAVGPLVAMFLVYQHGHAAVDLQYDWSMILLILFGAICMIIGLWVLGHKVISTLGEKITKVTPPSGFAMELGTGFTVLVASKIGIPVSTTHCAVGAVVCVGWFKSHEGGVSWRIFRNIAIAWVVTLPVASAVAALAAYLLRECLLR